MIGSLPDWYPLANATDEEVDVWLSAETPPYDEMREALPWLDKTYQFDAWIEGTRDTRDRLAGTNWLAEAFPSIAMIPLPPRLAAARATL